MSTQHVCIKVSNLRKIGYDNLRDWLEDDNNVIKENMLQSILSSSIFVHHISKYLYPKEINNVYASCKSKKEIIEVNSKYIYTNVCLHHQPHGYISFKCGGEEVQTWYRERKLHRDGDLPARIWPDGLQEWFKNGKKHRDGDLPAFISSSGLVKKWYIRGHLHREGNLPAIIRDDYIVSPNNSKYEWYIDGIYQGQT